MFRVGQGLLRSRCLGHLHALPCLAFQELHDPFFPSTSRPSLMASTPGPAPLFLGQVLRESLRHHHAEACVGDSRGQAQLPSFLQEARSRVGARPRLFHLILTARCPSKTWCCPSRRLKDQAGLCQSRWPPASSKVLPNATAHRLTAPNTEQAAQTRSLSEDPDSAPTAETFQTSQPSLCSSSS